MPTSPDLRPPTSRQPGTTLSLVTLAIAASLFVYVLWSRGDLGAGGSRVVAARGDLAAGELTTIEIFDSASQSVVFIRNVPGPVDTTQTPSRGTGILWDSAGHIVTNFHVVQGTDALDVVFQDGTRLPGRVVGASPDFDLAVVRVQAPRRLLVPLRLGTSGDLKVGQKVFAIGNPFGLDHTLTTGVISGLERAIEAVSNLVIRGVIQTDAAINPGNSGGPLLDSAGRLIGINTAIKSPTGSYVGVGFAVPVDTVNRLVPRILAEGLAERAGLGILVGPDDWVMDLGFEGAVVRYVYADSAADRSGFRGAREDRDGVILLGDVIVAIEDEEIHSSGDLFQALEGYREGEVVRVKVARFEGGGRSVEPTLQELTVELQDLD
jgi:S1-C subfamily serine protease